MEYIITTILVLLSLVFIYKKIKSREKCAKCGNVGMCLSKDCDVEEMEIEKKEGEFSKTV
jgi:hypothetical protein